MNKSFLVGGLLMSSIAAIGSSGYAAEVGDVEIYASVYSTNSWKEHGLDEPGMYKFKASGYSRELVYQDPDIDASGGGVMTDDFYFCTAEYNYGPWTDVTHYVINPETWRTVSSLRDGDYGAVASDMTYDPVTAKIYGCFNGDDENSPMVFGTLNEATGERFAITELATPWIACSVDKSGNLYAVDTAGTLLSVNKVTGALTTLGNLGFTATQRSTGAIDPRTGIFYVVVTNSVDNPDEYAYYKLNESYLYAVDIASATARQLYKFEDGEALGGMFIPGAVAEDGAPAAATDLAVDFPNGSLNGKVSFTIPSTTFDGTAANGEVSYLVRANGSLLAEGKANYGDKVEADAKISEADTYEIDLVLSNSVGRSPKTKITQWLGPDSPKPVTDVTASWNDGVFTVAWKEPTESLHGGYFDPEKITYIVTRQPDGVVVADNTTASSLTDLVDVPEKITAYNYEVVMVYDGTRSLAVSSNSWRLGSVSLPYVAKFEDEDALDLFTVIDVDGDKIEWYREWEFYVEETDELIPVASYPYSSSRNSANDWLITPPAALKAGKTYTVSYKALTDYSDAEPLLALYCGTEPSVEGMTCQIMAPVEITSLQPAENKVNFKVEKDGIYYIGFHACSEPDRSAIAITEIGLSEQATANDLSVNAVEYAKEIATHTAFDITATVANLGSEPAENVEVIFSRDNIEFAKQTVPSVSPGAKVEVTATDKLTPFHNATPVYTVKVVCDKDENLANNTLTGEPARLMLSESKTVGDLSASRADGKVTLVWSDPTAASATAAAPVTDSFENYAAWSTDGAGDWKFVSLDGTPANEMELAQLPNLGEGKDIAYMVLDATGIDQSFSAYSGTKSLLAVYNDEYNDDWAISPELSGDAQTVTFMGRSYDDYYLENIAVMYSTTDNDINSFDYLPEGGVYDEISHEWTKYSFDLPAGAKYFAIGYVSECKVAFLLDDVTFIPAGGTSAPATPAGYNVYRDGEKINDAPVTETIFIDTPDSDSEPTYHVTALYTDGESRLSNPCKVLLTGVTVIGSDNESVDIEVIDGGIIVRGGDSHVYTTDGRLVANATGGSTITAPRGIYLVKTATAVTKVAVN